MNWSVQKGIYFHVLIWKFPLNWGSSLWLNKMGLLYGVSIVTKYIIVRGWHCSISVFTPFHTSSLPSHASAPPHDVCHTSGSLSQWDRIMSFTLQTKWVTSCVCVSSQLRLKERDTRKTKQKKRTRQTTLCFDQMTCTKADH